MEYNIDNIEMNHFHIKSRNVRVLIFSETFQKCTTYFYFENGKVGTEYQMLSTCSCYEHGTFRHVYALFYGLVFSKTVFLSNYQSLLPLVQDLFQDTVRFFWNFNKIKGYATLDTLRKFAFFNSFLQAKIFTWKKDCELQML